jgi:hypothetical protein
MCKWFSLYVRKRDRVALRAFEMIAITKKKPPDHSGGFSRRKAW